MSAWVTKYKSAEAYQAADVHLSELKKTQFLMFDESPVEVLKIDPEELKAEYWDEAKYRKKADDIEDECRKNCYMWVVLGGTKEHPVFSYNFRWTRSGKTSAMEY